MGSNTRNYVIECKRLCHPIQEIMWSNVIHYRRWKSLMQSRRLSANIGYGTTLTGNWDIGKSGIQRHSAIIFLKVILHHRPCHFEHNTIYPSNVYCNHSILLFAILKHVQWCTRTVVKIWRHGPFSSIPSNLFMWKVFIRIGLPANFFSASKLSLTRSKNSTLHICIWVCMLILGKERSLPFA